jgi:uncharacterized protein YtpQ (UPF0354 family)
MYNFLERKNISGKLEEMLSDVREGMPCIRSVLVNKKQQKDWLSDKPYRDLGDMAEVFVLELAKDPYTALAVDNALIENYRTDTKQLHEIAVKNMGRDSKYVLFRKISEDMEGFSLYVLTNQNKYYGASQVLNDKALQRVSRELFGDFYILPSSVHEVLIVPENVKEKASVTELQAIIKEVNETLSLEELLSGSVYKYDHKTHDLLRAEGEEFKVLIKGPEPKDIEKGER